MLSLVARLIASGSADSKAALTHATGLSRATASAYVDTLMRRGIVTQLGAIAPDGRGRPAIRLGLSPHAGAILVADIGAAHTHLAIIDLGQNILAYTYSRLDVREGPEATLHTIASQLRDMLQSSDARGLPVRGVVVGLPARIDNATRVPVRPGIMPGWDGFNVRSWFDREFSSPVIVENDVNLRALGEAAALDLDQLPLLVIKIGTGIGAGHVDERGHVHTGFDGAAGEVGHIPVRGAPAWVCTCGTVGCVEAVASVPSIIRQVKEASPHAFDDSQDDIDQLLHLVSTGDPETIQVVRRAAEYMGEAVAILCNMLNPRRIVLGGELSSVTDEVLAGVRSVTYQNARPLATRNLVIRHSVLGEFAGIAGGVVMGIEAALSPRAMKQLKTV